MSSSKWRVLVLQALTRAVYVLHMTAMRGMLTDTDRPHAETWAIILVVIINSPSKNTCIFIIPLSRGLHNIYVITIVKALMIEQLNQEQFIVHSVCMAYAQRMHGLCIAYAQPMHSYDDHSHFDTIFDLLKQIQLIDKFTGICFTSYTADCSVMSNLIPERQMEYIWLSPCTGSVVSKKTNKQVTS